MTEKVEIEIEHQAEHLQAFRLMAGAVVHVDGFPFTLAESATVLGREENADALLATHGERLMAVLR